MTHFLSHNDFCNSLCNRLHNGLQTYLAHLKCVAKPYLRAAIIFGPLLALSASFVEAKPYKIDKARSNLEFQAVYMLINKTKGNFGTYNGNVDFDEKSRTLKVLNGEMEMKSIDTKNQKRDDHLRQDFLNVEKFPTGKFVMKSVKGHKLTADLTLRGVTKSVVFDYELNGPVEDPMKQKKFINIELKGKVNRKDFGIESDSTFEATLKDEIEIYIEIGAHESHD